MDLAPEIRAYLDDMAAAGAPPMHTLPIPQVRDIVIEITGPMNAEPEPVHRIEQSTIEGPGGPIPVRIYTPRPLEDGERLPVLLYFHGGGYMFGIIEIYDTICQYLANHGDCIVISVGYRLAPEHKFPAAFDDCLAATRWAAANADGFGGDGSRVAVSGESSGGTLAAAVAKASADRHDLTIGLQILFYPIIDNTKTYPSEEAFDQGYFLTGDMMRWFMDNTCNDPEDARDPRLSPMLSDDLSGVAPALVITAGFDPLRDEGEAYARKLDAAGVPVTYSCYGDMIHAFIAMSAITGRAFDALEEAAQAMRKAFAS